MKFKFKILPTPKQSVRSKFINGRTVYYQDKKHSDYKDELIRQYLEQVHGVRTILFPNGPLGVRVNYIFPPLKSFNKTQMDAINNNCRIYKYTKPDVTDNLNKGLFDALEGYLYPNDSRIASIEANKFYGKEPLIELEIFNLNEIDETY